MPKILLLETDIICFYYIVMFIVDIKIFEVDTKGTHINICGVSRSVLLM